MSPRLPKSQKSPTSQNNVLGRRKTYAKKVVKNDYRQEEAGPRRNPNSAKYPPGVRFAAARRMFWTVFGFFLGRLPLGGHNFLTLFLAYVLRRPKNIILLFLGYWDLDIPGDMAYINKFT